MFEILYLITIAHTASSHQCDAMLPLPNKSRTLATSWHDSKNFLQHFRCCSMFWRCAALRCWHSYCLLLVTSIGALLELVSTCNAHYAFSSHGLRFAIMMMILRFGSSFEFCSMSTSATATQQFSKFNRTVMQRLLYTNISFNKMLSHQPINSKLSSSSCHHQQESHVDSFLECQARQKMREMLTAAAEVVSVVAELFLSFV